MLNICIYIYIYIYLCVCVYIYIYIISFLAPAGEAADGDPAVQPHAAEAAADPRAGGHQLI